MSGLDCGDRTVGLLCHGEKLAEAGFFREGKIEVIAHHEEEGVVAGEFLGAEDGVAVSQGFALFDEGDLDANKAVTYLSELEKLEPQLRESALVEIMSSALRRFALTKNIESAANAIEPALEIMSVKNDNNLSIIKYIAWAIPSIGFLGTVRGIGQAMSQAKEAVGGDIGPMTSSLGVAFNSTFVALIVSVFLMMVLTYLQNEQDSQLVKIKGYTEKYLINRIKHD